MKLRHAFLAAAGALLGACNDATRPTTTPEAVPSFDLAATAAVTGWLGGVLPAAEVGADQAQVFKDIGCGILVDPATGAAIFTTGKAVVTPSGNATLICHGELPATIPAPEGGAVIIEDLPCGTPGGGTNQSHTVITPSGRVTLTCHVHPA
jgi:hypothetical protein